MVPALLLGVLSSVAAIGAAEVDAQALGAGNAKKRDPYTIRFADIHAAQHRADLRVTHHRMVRLDDGSQALPQSSVVTHETALFRPASAKASAIFRLDLIGIAGQSLDAARLAERRRLFTDHAAYLFRYASFRIADPELAEQNYELRYLYSEQAALGPANVFLVSPRHPGRRLWVITVDQATDFPVRVLEFDPGHRLVGELRVQSLDIGESAALPNGDGWGWQATSQVAVVADGAEAKRRSGVSAAVLPKGTELPAGFQEHGARVIVEPTRPDAALAVDYTDGLDFVHLHEQRTEPQLHAARSGAGADDGGGHTIEIFRGVDAVQLRFEDRGLEVMVLARCLEQEARVLAESLYRRRLQAR